MKSPIETLFVIANSTQRKHILKILTENGIYGKVLLAGNGTAKSKIGDIFGFSIIEKDVLISFVNSTDSEKICYLLNSAINRESYEGIVFTTPVDAISSDLFQIVNGGKNGK